MRTPDEWFIDTFVQRRLRRYVMRNRGCPVRPSTLHIWASVEYLDHIECAKCGAWKS